MGTIANFLLGMVIVPGIPSIFTQTETLLKIHGGLGQWESRVLDFYLYNLQHSTITDQNRSDFPRFAEVIFSCEYDELTTPYLTSYDLTNRSEKWFYFRSSSYSRNSYLISFSKSEHDSGDSRRTSAGMKWSCTEMELTCRDTYTWWSLFCTQDIPRARLSIPLIWQPILWEMGEPSFWECMIFCLQQYWSRISPCVTSSYWSVTWRRLWRLCLAVNCPNIIIIHSYRIWDDRSHFCC